MARRNMRSVKFAKPGQYILNMILFLAAVGAVVYYLSPFSPQPTTLLVDAFNANVGLNGLILFVLFIGVVYNINAAAVPGKAATWFEAFQENADPRTSRRMPRAPGLISAVTTIVLDSYDQGGRLSRDTTRAILDSVGTRMDEGRDLGRYIGNLLVFLGLLGTFWGLLETVNAVADTISGLAVSGGAAEDAVAQLITNLKEPLSGMGTAFSSSLFGLGGSLIVGFLDLQAAQAQGRFYTDLEDYLATMTDNARSPDGTSARLSIEGVDGELGQAFDALERTIKASTDEQIRALAEQNAELRDEIRALNRTLIRVGGGE